MMPDRATSVPALVLLACWSLRLVAAPVALSSDAAFSTTASSTELLLVAFTVPWCSYCRALLPILKDAERLLEASNLTSVVVAEVDCELGPHICSEHLAAEQRYPTVVLFRRGHQIVTYTGRRNAQDIATFVYSYHETSALFNILPSSMLSLLSRLRRPALVNAVGGFALASSSAQSLLRFSTAIVAFSAVWCTWLVGGFFFGPTLPTGVSVTLVCLITVGLGRQSTKPVGLVGCRQGLPGKAKSTMTMRATRPMDRQHEFAKDSGMSRAEHIAEQEQEPEPEPDPELELKLMPEPEVEPETGSETKTEKT